MLILAIDLGKAKSLACWYQTDDATHASSAPCERAPTTSERCWPIVPSIES
jgi:hypothetical protein